MAQASSLGGIRHLARLIKCYQRADARWPHSHDGCATSKLFLADVVIERIGAKDSALRAANDPFLTIGVITRLADGIIGYYVHYQVLISLIN